MPYATVAELRGEGVTDPPYSYTRCSTAIDRATAFIDMATGQFFESRSQVLLLDGRGHRELHLSIPIISVSKVEVGGDLSWSEVDLDEVEIYNRHMSGQVSPDDRYNPRIVRGGEGYAPGARLDRELFDYYWPLGTQNVRVTGKFGFTDYAGPTYPEGITPPLIKLACLRLAVRELPGVGTPEWAEERAAGRVTSERTRDQAISLAKPYTYEKGGYGVGTVLTGDPEVDQILARYRRPIAVRGV